MKRAPISACFGLVLVFGILSAAAQGNSSDQPVRRTVRAEQNIASAEVHIAPTTMQAGGTSIDIAGDHWIARGYDLKTLIAQIYDIDERRIDLAEDGSADARYDVSLTLPREVDEDLIQQMLKAALEKKFRLNITAENRSMDVYVLSAPNGPGLSLHRHGSPTSEDAQQITYEGRDCSGKTSANGIAASAGTISEFRRTLEPELDRLLVDETNLRGSYDFKIGNYANQQALFKLMHDELGIVVTPTERKVATLTVRPSQGMRAAM